MKPDWKDAPEWANYLAQDEDGDWYWFEKEPYLKSGTWLTNEGRIEDANGPEYQDSLEQRP